MINTLTSGKIKRLQKMESIPSVSIYLSMIPGYSGSETNRIRFKNALRTAQRMANSQVLPLDAQRDEKWIAQANLVTNNFELWESQSKGLAVFISSDNLFVFRVNHPFETRIFVGMCFITEPLVGIEPEISQKYYVLALSQKNTRLFKVSAGKAHQIDTEKMPKSLKETLRLDEPSKDLQTHMTGIGGHKGSEGFHGHGFYKDKHKPLVDKFIHALSRRVETVIKESKQPLYVIGTVQLTAQYRKINKYDQLVLNNIHGSVDHLDGEHIQKLIQAEEKRTKVGTL